VKQVARELGCATLEGSVRKAGNRLRITGRFDRYGDRLASLGRALRQRARRHLWHRTSSVRSEPRLRSAETERVIGKPTQSLDAHDLYLRALAAAVARVVKQRGGRVWTGQRILAPLAPSADLHHFL
jgi:hypothetical protein